MISGECPDVAALSWWTRRGDTIGLVPASPEPTKTSLAQRLRTHARDHWPQLRSVTVRYRGTFAGSPQDALDCACDLYLARSGH